MEELKNAQYLFAGAEPGRRRRRRRRCIARPRKQKQNQKLSLEIMTLEELLPLLPSLPTEKTG